MAISVFPISTGGSSDRVSAYVVNNPAYSSSLVNNTAVISRTFAPGAYMIQLNSVSESLESSVFFTNSGSQVGFGYSVGSNPNIVVCESEADQMSIALTGDIGNASFIITLTELVSELPTNQGYLQTLQIYESSATVAVNSDNTPYLIIGGGGGGASPVFQSWTGCRGGGSGYISVGSVNSGSYPLVVGVGGSGSSGLNSDTGSDGGTTTFAGDSATGGERGIGTGGGSGGSGGGGGGGAGGFNGSNGVNGGTGSGYQVPLPFSLFADLEPVATPTRTSTNQKNPGLGGGFYAGGSGQHGSNNYGFGAYTPIDGTAGTRGGGGGAGGGGANNAGAPVGVGGAGGTGMLAILRTVEF